MAADNKHSGVSFGISNTTIRWFSSLLVRRVAERPRNVSADLETYHIPIPAWRTGPHILEYVYLVLFRANARTILEQQEISDILSYMRSNGRNIVSRAGPYRLA